MSKCICAGNWREIVKESEAFFDKQYVNDNGDEFTFFGVVHAKDDYYYGMNGKSGLRLLSCVGSLETHGFFERPEYMPWHIPSLERAWEALNNLIEVGPLPGNGFDKTAQRNGIVLAANELRSIIDRATEGKEGVE
jgi:hypothetical protein